MVNINWENDRIVFTPTNLYMEYIYFRHGWYRRLSKKKTFKKEIYSRRNNVESIFSVIKRKYSGINKSKSTRLQNKETRLKTLVYNIDQITKIQT